VTLPKIQTSFETVDVAGAVFDVRCLTRAESARMQKLVEAETDAAELEIECIAAATDTPVDETRDWYAATPAWAVAELIDHIQRISRLSGEAQKSG
jgi:hypothetical protein